MNKNELLRLLPSIDSLRHHAKLISQREIISSKYIAILARKVIDDLRANIISGNLKLNSANEMENLAIDQLRKSIEKIIAPGIRKVINGTGIILFLVIKNI